MVDTFLAMGADPNIQAKDGNTALHHAVMEDRGDIVKTLLAMGADKTIRNKVGKDALDLARMRGIPYIVKAVNEGTGDKPTFTVEETVAEAAKRGREKAQEAAPAPSPRRMAM